MRETSHAIPASAAQRCLLHELHSPCYRRRKHPPVSDTHGSAGDSPLPSCLQQQQSVDANMPHGSCRDTGQFPQTWYHQFGWV